MMKSLLTTLLLITGISMAQQPPNPFPPSIPQTMSFQAMMTDTLGNPVTDGTHNFTFRINRPTQAGQVQTIWEETKQVTVVDGLISTILGSVNPIGFIPFSDNYFLRVALDNEVISVSPLTSVPFAFNASRAMGANNATHADTANFTHQAGHAMHADTAHFVMNTPMSDTANFAHHSQHSEHADTAYHAIGYQAADDDLSDLADGTLSASKVENGGYFISSAGTSGQVWTSDGDSTGAWATASSGASSINDLSDALVENSSIYLGSDPSGTTVGAQFNVAVGVYALGDITYGDSNIAIGVSALTNNTTGSYNNAVGSAALGTNTTGGWNTANGYNSLVLNTTGSNNTGIGAFALGYNTTGSANAAIGMKSLRGNTTGTRNIAFGNNALDEGDTENDNLAIGYDALGGVIDGGEYNVAIGNYSLDSNTTGDNNIAVGYNALTGNTTGADNTALGYDAGDVLTTGSNNVILGSGADPSDNIGTNQIVIGKGATGHGDNIAVIGNGSNTAIHPHDNNEVDLGSSSYKFKNLHLAGSALVGVASTITSSATFNGAETIIPVNTSSGSITITIDSDQKVAGRILIFKQIAGVGNSFTIATEGSEQIQGHLGVGLDDTYQANSAYQTVNLFCDGSNWYDLDG